MLELYFFPSPNGQKALICLEELALPYTLTPVDLAKGEQFDAAFLQISPNNKIPALVDHGAEGGALALFESGAILEYLADKTGRLLPKDLPDRYAVKQWLYWQVGGLGPMAGQAHHFRAFAPEQVPYAIRRYTDEMNRLYGVLDQQLESREYIAGDYSIADIACWPWVVPHERQGQTLDDFPNLRRWFARVSARPAVQRAQAFGNERLLSPEEYTVLLNQTRDTARALQRNGET
ncbi:MAG: glutathione S-transferase N-terminal domain-containing protein [Pseudomonadota bacterium]